MSVKPVWPGTGRITLAALAVVPAALAYPWRSPREQWVLGIALAAVIVLFGWWRGLHFTTILRRRIALLLGRGSEPAPAAAPDAKTTALVRVGPPAAGDYVLPLALIARYLDRYGVRLDSIRITSRDGASGERDTWIGLTLSAAANLAALQARAAQIPLRETAEVVARRLADHLREVGWEASLADADEVPALLAQDAREKWNWVQQGDSDYSAAYRVDIDDELSATLDAIRSQPAFETWTALEIVGGGDAGAQYAVAAACAVRAQEPPGGGTPFPGLTPQRGYHRAALSALDPLSAQRLDGHTAAPDGLLSGLAWPTPEAGAHRADGAVLS